MTQLLKGGDTEGGQFGVAEEEEFAFKYAEFEVALKWSNVQQKDGNKAPQLRRWTRR